MTGANASAVVFDLSGTGQSSTIVLTTGDISISIEAGAGNVTQTDNGLGVDASGANPATGLSINDLSPGLDNNGFDDFIRIRADDLSGNNRVLELKSITFAEWGSSGADHDSAQIIALQNHAYEGTANAGQAVWNTPDIMLNTGIVLAARGESGNGGSDFRILNLEVVAATAVPVPAAAWLFGSAVFALAGLRGRRRTI